MLYRLWLNFELLAHSGRQIKHLSMDKYWELLLTLLLIFLASVLRPWQRIKHKNVHQNALVVRTRFTGSSFQAPSHRKVVFTI